jgi:hypothetical protein
LVSGGVLVLDDKKSKTPLNGKFKIFFINSRYFLIPIWIAVAISLFFLNRSGFELMFEIQKISWASSPSLIFAIFAIAVTIFAIIREWSLIPVLGLLTNLYLMSELGVINWMRFLIWLVIGLLIYFFYSYNRSKLKKS